MSFKSDFDHVVLNENLDVACEETMRLIRNFLKA